MNNQEYEKDMCLRDPENEEELDEQNQEILEQHNHYFEEDDQGEYQEGLEIQESLEEVEDDDRDGDDGNDGDLEMEEYSDDLNMEADKNVDEDQIENQINLEINGIQLQRSNVRKRLSQYNSKTGCGSR